MTTDISQQIEAMAKLQFIDEEIATICQIDYKTLIKNHRDDIDRGRLLAEAEIRQAIIKTATEGNTSAQSQFMQMNNKAKSKTKQNKWST